MNRITDKLRKCLLLLGCLASSLLGRAAEESTFKDIKVDLTYGNLLTEEEVTKTDGNYPKVSFDIAFDEGGNIVRTESGVQGVATLEGKFHSDEHGWNNFKATVAVPGPVRVSMGTCAWGGDVTVTDGNGGTLNFNTNTGACYHNDKTNNIASVVYKGEATTLTISGGSYTPYFAVEQVDPASLVEEVTVTYAVGEGVEGVVPAAVKAEVGSKITLPKNFTMYKEGKTMVGWSDGEKEYELGGEYTVPSEAVTLTAVFADNTVSLADRTEAVTVKWNFRRDQGAPELAYQNMAGILVTQAVVGGASVDVKMAFTTNDGGKLNNKNNSDCAQCNNNTTFTIPSCKGAQVNMEAYGGSYIFKADGKTATTVDGQSDYEAGALLSYTIGGSGESVDIVMGNDAGYVRYVQVELPVIESSAFVGKAAEIVYDFNTSDVETLSSASAVTPANGFSVAAAEFGDLKINGVEAANKIVEEDANVVFVKFRPEGSTNAVAWNVKPAKGLTFTPTKVTMRIARFGTDAQSGVVISAKKAEGESVTLGTYTAPRNKKSKTEDAFGSSSDYATNALVTIELTEDQQKALASEDVLTVSATVGVGATKDGGFSDVHIYGLLNGELASVNKYALTATANLADGGSVTVYPNSEEYEEGSSVMLTATRNFGYKFVNWTDGEGKEVSTEAKLSYTVSAAATLTANFEKINTYEFNYSVVGTNAYMVQASPAPTVVDKKNMYEEGTTVTLTASSYEGFVSFTDWSDGSTNSSYVVTMNEDKQISANYTEADIIAGWDFYKRGNSGRVADFAAQDNEADALTLVDADGNTASWLDKSTEADSKGYETFAGAAVNWNLGSKEGEVGKYHWQTKVNASAFTNIRVQFQMLYNFNAYQSYNVEFSTDGKTWVGVGSITMEGVKSVAKFDQTLPEAANNQAELYIRMIADKTSKVDGTASKNDGNALAMFFITGEPRLVDDGKAPALVRSVPADGATSASATGKIVLTFDERIEFTEGASATLDGEAITGVVSGKTVTFSYKGLAYSTEHSFVLAASSVADLTGNALTEETVIRFTTMTRPTVEKTMYDAVVSTNEELTAALLEAERRSDKSKRFRIFLLKGTYTLPVGNLGRTTAKKSYTLTLADESETTVSFVDPITYLTSGNISLIGEDRDATVITNSISNEAEYTFVGKYGTASVFEGIGNGDVLQLTGSNYYFQDLTVSTAIADARGRDIAVQDKGTNNIYKNVSLHGYQDTWTSNNDNGLYYFEGGVLRGRTDYLCGKGDAYFNETNLVMCAAGGYLAVPSKAVKYGFVFKGCTIDGEADNIDGNYTLGRPWGSGTPRAQFIDTKMNVLPSAEGWSEMSNGWPARFAEYNSMTKTGTQISLTGRKVTFGGKANVNNPVLTAEEADELSDMHNMFGDWDPTLATEQAPAVTAVGVDGNELVWTGSDYALLYAICKNGNVVAFTTESNYDITELNEEGAVWGVRAANEMGGLGEIVNADGASVITAMEGVEASSEVVAVEIYTLQGQKVARPTRGLNVVVSVMSDGSTRSEKVLVK
ncbi:MAG: Ig-like domain-containing protein [Bacteroidales bacterium]|nr:Ig-like domain-containing protein [Bacteroidales bacterium]